MKKLGLVAASVFVAYFFILFYFGAGFSAGPKFGHLTAFVLTGLLVGGIWYIVEFRVFDRKRKTCTRCGGTGFLTNPASNEQTDCPSCAGAGSISELKTAITVLGVIAVFLTINIMALRAMVSVRRSETPLHQAILARNLDEVRRLLDGGADPNALLDQGNGYVFAPIHLAIPSHLAKETDTDVAVLESLISHGAEVDKRDGNGGTALMSAVVSPAPRCAVLLIEKGADPTITDRSNRNVLRDLPRLPQLKTPLAPDGPTPEQMIRDALSRKGHKVPAADAPAG